MNRSLKAAKLYLILDTEVADYQELFDILKQALTGGVDIVQLRDKEGTARQIVDFSRRVRKYLRQRIPFIINDRVDCAVASAADGVHLGQEDLPIETARKILGPRAIIGISCQTLTQARLAQIAGADYIGFGSVFKTLTKPKRPEMNPQLLAQVIRKISIPVFAIGGINADNISQIVSLGVNRVAITRAVSLAKDAKMAVQELRLCLENKSKK
jgi:thiamine-phosphate pyrophosphorylase